MPCPSSRRRRVAPDSCEAVGLELQTDRQSVGLLGIALLLGAHLGLDAQQLLQVMASLVRDDVRLRELALDPELLFQLSQEPEVEVDPLVGGAVERTDLGGGLPASRGRRAVEERQLRRLVRRPAAVELLDSTSSLTTS